VRDGGDLQALAGPGDARGRLRRATISAAFAELHETRFVFYESNVVWVRTRVKHIRQKTTQIATAIRNDLARIPKDHPFRAQFVETYGKLVWLSEALSGDPLEGPIKAIQPKDGHSTVYGGGTGVGTGGKGWGSGRGNKRDASQPAYSPDPQAVALRDEHFPDQPVEAVASCSAMLRIRRQPVTPDAVRALLFGEVAA
jgi:hypothetical protein